MTLERSSLETFLSAESIEDLSDSLVAVVRESELLVEGEGAPPLRAFLDDLDGDAEKTARFVAALERFLAETDGTALFGETGVPSDRGFFAELGMRASGRVLPIPRDDRDLTHVFQRFFTTFGDVERFAALPSASFHRLAELLAARLNEDASGRLRAAFADGFRLLLVRVQSHGLSKGLRRRSSPGPVSQSPFQRVAFAGDALLAAWLEGRDATAASSAFHRASRECREQMEVIQQSLVNVGVSVEIVFGLEVIDRCLTRSAVMADIMEIPPGPRRSQAIHLLLSRLAYFAHRDRSLRHLLKWNLQLLDRKIVDRSSATGEHYVATTRTQYRHLWAAAAGGGLLTVGTAALKVLIHRWHIAAFPEGFLYGLNYAVSFLLLQAFGLILATKQPAMTAAALASIMRDTQGQHREERIAAFVSRLVSSQIAAAVANVLAVGAGAAAFSALFAWLAGRPYLAPDEARHTLASLSPLDSGTVFFAALTGVLLWIGSLAGGWFENWTVVHRLPEAIASHPLGRRFGRARMKSFAASLSRNASGWGTNVALGFLLGFAPAVGRFFGIPFDVRHVTLSTGTLSLAADSLGARWFEGGFFLRALAGIAVMFVLNLSVSFSLSLFNAVRAYQMPNEELLGVLMRVVSHAARRPLEFLRPPGEAADEAHP